MCWNWKTTRLQIPWPLGVGVRVSSSAPSSGICCVAKATKVRTMANAIHGATSTLRVQVPSWQIPDKIHGDVGKWLLQQVANLPTPQGGARSSRAVSSIFWEVNRTGVRHPLETDWLRKELPSIGMLPASVGRDENGWLSHPSRKRTYRKVLSVRSAPLPPSLECAGKGSRSGLNPLVRQRWRRISIIPHSSMLCVGSRNGMAVGRNPMSLWRKQVQSLSDTPFLWYDSRIPWFRQHVKQPEI